MSTCFIDWWEVDTEAKNGTLLRYMREKIPREHWNEVDAFVDEESLLHAACRGHNIDAILVFVNECNININIQDDEEETPLHYAIYNDQPQVAKVLLVLGAQMISSYVFLYHKMATETTKVLIANGLRLKNVIPHRLLAPPDTIILFEHGVVLCRDVIVTLLGLKKRRRDCYHGNGQSLILPKLDRFLVKQVLAVEIWATRY